MNINYAIAELYQSSKKKIAVAHNFGPSHKIHFSLIVFRNCGYLIKFKDK
jgi:hypothetical protein